MIPVYYRSWFRSIPKRELKSKQLDLLLFGPMVRMSAAGTLADKLLRIKLKAQLGGMNADIEKARLIQGFSRRNVCLELLLTLNRCGLVTCLGGLCMSRSHDYDGANELSLEVYNCKQLG